MANAIVTPQWITRESLRILHQKSNFIGRINRQYDDSFKVSGAKIGTNLQVRLPNKYTVRTGPTMAAQNTVERFVTLPVATQRGVDVNFSSLELTMQVDDFSERILKPAVSRLTANVESNTLALGNQVYTSVGTSSALIGFNTVAASRRFLDDALAPDDGMRSLHLGTQGQVNYMQDTKALFHAGSALDEQFLDGMVDRALGYDVFANSLVTPFVAGTYGGAPVVNGAGQGVSGIGNAYSATSSLVTNGWTAGGTTLNAGDIFTMAGVYAVHDETKQNLGYLKQFVVVNQVSDTAGAITATISPALILSGAYQNVTNSPAAGAVITMNTPSAAVVGTNLAYHRDAFIFASADLILPGSISKDEFAEREVFDGISLRVVRRYDINNDLMPARIDVLFGSTVGLIETSCKLISQIA
jgi:hypothetical protein